MAPVARKMRMRVWVLIIISIYCSILIAVVMGAMVVNQIGFATTARELPL